ncbi:MAG: DcrB-related protein [Sphingomonadales bacterium]|nr:DcrB-related protein [Sphingomonadales bacterium]
MKKAQMVCPPGWIDRSMTIMSAPGADQSGVAANMVVTRDRMPGDLPHSHPQRMHALLDRQVLEMRRNMAEFRELWRKVDAEHPVAEIMVQWRTPQAPVAQWITFADLGRDDMMIATATAGRDTFGDHEATFHRMMKSLVTG